MFKTGIAVLFALATVAISVRAKALTNPSHVLIGNNDTFGNILKNSTINSNQKQVQSGINGLKAIISVTGGNMPFDMEHNLMSVVNNAYMTITSDVERAKKVGEDFGYLYKAYDWAVLRYPRAYRFTQAYYAELLVDGHEIWVVHSSLSCI